MTRINIICVGGLKEKYLKDAILIPQSAVYHLGGGALAYDNPRKTYLNFRNNLLMIYKNLPQPYLRRVLLGRFVLDYIAALQALVTLKPRHFAAIIRARIDYLHMKLDFAQIRQQNLNLASHPYPDMNYLRLFHSKAEIIVCTFFYYIEWGRMPHSFYINCPHFANSKSQK